MNIYFIITWFILHHNIFKSESYLIEWEHKESKSGPPLHEIIPSNNLYNKRKDL
jgi:hypothetical protein